MPRWTPTLTLADRCQAIYQYTWALYARADQSYPGIATNSLPPRFRGRRIYPASRHSEHAHI